MTDGWEIELDVENKLRAELIVISMVRKIEAYFQTDKSDAGITALVEDLDVDVAELLHEVSL